MKKFVTMLTILLVSICGKISAKELNFKTDSGVVIESASVDCLVSADDTRSFAVLLKDGTSLTDVHALTTTEESAVRDLRAPKESILIAENRILLSQMAAGSIVKVYSLNGEQMLQAAAKDSTISIDIRSLQQGVYILKTPESSVKFIKK